MLASSLLNSESVFLVQMREAMKAKLEAMTSLDPLRHL